MFNTEFTFWKDRVTSRSVGLVLTESKYKLFKVI